LFLSFANAVCSVSNATARGARPPSHLGEFATKPGFLGGFGGGAVLGGAGSVVAHASHAAVAAEAHGTDASVASAALALRTNLDAGDFRQSGHGLGRLVGGFVLVALGGTVGPQNRDRAVAVDDLGDLRSVPFGWLLVLGRRQGAPFFHPAHASRGGHARAVASTDSSG